MKKVEIHNENSLVNLSNSIIKHFGAPGFHNTIPEIDESLKGHKKVVAVLFDGMGQNIVRMHLKENSFIRKNYITTINSTFQPSQPVSIGYLPVKNAVVAAAVVGGNVELIVVM